MKKMFYTVIALCMAMTMQATDVVTFEDVLTLEGENAVLNEDNYQQNFYDEDLEAGMFTSLNGDFVFENYCMEDWDFYCGFSISARTETTFAKTTPDQFNSCVGHGVYGSARYAVFYDASSMMPLQEIRVGTQEDLPVSGFYITNTAWVVKSILEGDGYGGAFTTGDYLKLMITGINSEGEKNTVTVYLADFTSENEAEHTYINDWTWVDLSSLGAVAEIQFVMDGSRKNDWGITTPTYFCMDDFNGVAPVSVATFEDIEVGDEGHISVSTEDDDERTEFVCGSFEFATGCMSDWDFWYGFGYANRTQTQYETIDDQWNNVVGGGYDGSANYGVAYVADFMGPCYITLLGEPNVVPGFYITNSSWAYTAIKDGKGAKQFGLGDWFKLTITGYDADDVETGTKEFYLADLRDASTAYIIDDWRYVDLSELGVVAKLGFELSSTDNGDFGMNTPAYFCFDNFGATGEEVQPEKNVLLPQEIATFEDVEIGDDGHMSVSTEDDDERTEFVDGIFEFATGCMSDWDFWYGFGYANRTQTQYETIDDQWNNVVGGGYDGSANYGVAYVADFMGPCYVTVLGDEPIIVPGFYITNSSWAYTAIKDGKGAKQFGLGDWFKLTITGYDADDEVTGTKEFYLADLRDASTAYIIDDWRYVDLSELGVVAKLGFELSSTDNGDWGMNTPAYFCFDNFGATGEEILPEKNVDLLPTAIASHTSPLSPLRSYDLNGRQTNKLQKGVNIIRMSDGSVRKVMVK